MLFVICACQRTQDKQHSLFFQGTDSYNRSVSIEQEPQRIVSLSPAITEITFLLGAGDKLVGISDFCNYPEATQSIPSVGQLLHINIESILQVSPDLILISSIISKDDVAQLTKTGIPVFALKAETHLEEIYSTIETMGKLLNREDSAAAYIEHYRAELSNIQLRAPKQRPNIYYAVGYGATGDYTAPGNSYIHDIITMAGGHNCGEELTQWSISKEALFAHNPDYIFIRKEDLSDFCRTEPYTQLDAVKNNRVFPIESGWIDILGPRNLQAITYINHIITQE